MSDLIQMICSFFE